jgi:hypothetical protein
MVSISCLHFDLLSVKEPNGNLLQYYVLILILLSADFNFKIWNAFQNSKIPSTQFQEVTALHLFLET